MAEELTINESLVYDDGDITDSLSVEDFKVSLGTSKFIKGIQLVGETEEAIPLGEVTTPGQAAFKNLDSTNYVEIRVGTGGTKIVKLPPGGGARFHFASAITAPYWIATGGSCRCAFLICNT